MIASRKIRVLHSLGGLDYGGIESWLLQVLEHLDLERIQIDFLTHTRQAGPHEAAAKARGCRIHSCLPTGLRRPHRYWQYPRELRRILKKHGPYDIVHAHMQEFSGYVLKAASESEIPGRIAHSHNATAQAELDRAGALRHRYQARLRGWVDRYTTIGLACSDLAAQSLFGERWRSDLRYRLLNYGIDLKPFMAPNDRHSIRRQWELPDTHVIGHVGRFVEQKNHAFLLDVIEACVRRRPATHFVLIGDGPLRPEIERVARQRGLSPNVRFTGSRHDVPQLMLSAMDLLVFPSLWEGLGITVLEAQAAGLKAWVSDQVPPESCVIPGRVQWLSLSAGAEHWAERLLADLDSPRGIVDRASCLAAMSPVSVERSAHELQSLYLAGNGELTVPAVKPGTVSTR